MAEIIRDARLLKQYLSTTEACALLGVSRGTIGDYCRLGVLKRGLHWTKPGGGRTSRLIFMRDGLIAWLEERDRQHGPVEPVPTTRVNLARCPELASLIGGGNGR